MVIATSMFSQPSTPLAPPVQTDYLKKSKHQKTAAWIMLIGGTVTTTIGVAVSLSGGLDCAFGSPDCNKNQTLADILVISGSAAVLGSIPLFIASSKNKKKAAAISLKIEKATGLQQQGIAYLKYPALSFSVHLK